MKIGNRTYAVDWGHFTAVTLIAVVVILYLIDTRSTSLNVNNILFVQPASVIALLLYLLVLPQTIRRVTKQTPEGLIVIKDRGERAEPADESWADLGRVAALAAAFGLFVFGLERVGFDVMSWLFITVALYVCGERNWLMLAVFPIVAATLLILGFRLLMPYPIATMIL